MPQPLAGSVRRFSLIPLALAAVASAPLASMAQETLLVAIGEEWTFLKGTAAPPEDWAQLEFDDSGWDAGPTGIGYGDADDATVLSDMQNGYASVFARRRFRPADAGALEGLTLRITYDDGFVAYLNGAEVARSANLGVPDTPVDFAALTTAEHEAAAAESFSIDPALVDEGDNVLAIQVHNVNLTSSDLSLLPELVVNASICVQGLACSFQLGTGVTLSWTNTASYTSLKVRRDGQDLEEIDPLSTTYLDLDPPAGDVTYTVEGTRGASQCDAPPECVTRVFAPEDVLIGLNDEWRFLRGSEAPDAAWRDSAYDDSDWELGPTGIGYGDGDDLTELLDMRQVADDPLTPEDETQAGYLAVFLRRGFELSSLDGLQSLTLSVIHDDGFVAYLNGQEVGRVNMLDGEANELTAAAVAIDPGAPAVIEIPAGALQVGRNVLAVSVHNAALTSSDLSFIPILARVGGAPAGPTFLRGNADSQGGVNLTDAVFILRSLFQGGPSPTCLDAADADDSGLVNLTDAVVILRSLFQGGGALPQPFPVCGVDPSPQDPLAACAGSGC